MTRFSVLICTYNRPEMLKMSLDALINHTEEKPDQVVVVNGGDDSADEVVQKYSGIPGIQVRLVKTVNKNLATSRNIGLTHCRGDIIAMTDDDAQVFPDWVAQHKRLHARHPEAGAVGGRVIGMNSDTLVGQVADLITFPSWEGQRYVRTLPGVNISYKREVLDLIGLQDETLFRGEDVDYNWRVIKAGYQVLFDPSIQVYHFHRPTFKAFYNQHYMYGRAYYLVRKKWPEMYCFYPHKVRKLKDILKFVNFLASAFYQPWISAWKLKEYRNRIFSLPILFMSGFYWRKGILDQMYLEKSGKTNNLG